MAAVTFKYEYWQGSSGKWYCNIVKKQGHDVGGWYIAARILNIPLTDFVLLLKNDYNAEIYYKNGVLVYSWDNENQRDMLKFVKMINQKAKNFKF